MAGRSQLRQALARALASARSASAKPNPEMEMIGAGIGGIGGYLADESDGDDDGPGFEAAAALSGAIGLAGASKLTRAASAAVRGAMADPLRRAAPRSGATTSLRDALAERLLMAHPARGKAAIGAAMGDLGHRVIGDFNNPSRIGASLIDAGENMQQSGMNEFDDAVHQMLRNRLAREMGGSVEDLSRAEVWRLAQQRGLIPKRFLDPEDM